MKAKVIGLDGLSRQIDKLIAKANGPQMDAAMLRTGEVIADEMRQRVAVDDGGLKASIEVLPGRRERRGLHLVKVGPRWPKGAHAHLVEFGTRARMTKPRRRRALVWAGAEHPVAATSSGAARAKPFMRPAADASREKVRRTFMQELKKVVTP